jgi:hypothetical protein
MSDTRKITRRVAVSSMALATASLVIERGSSASEDKKRRGKKLNQISPGKKRPDGTLEEFFWQNAVSQEFTVVDYSWLESSERPPNAILTLQSVSRVEFKTNDDARPKDLRPCALSLMFEPQAEVDLLPACYHLVNKNLGKFDFLLSKTKTESGTVYYEVVLN